ncbi:MAG TPA: phosphoglycerate kinase [Oscillospiraceae bacterium]|nr:phosphoglycerate kinase [Oscillospiraceae bacterium]
MTIKTVKDVAWAGKRVFTRVDFNVPRTEQGAVADDTKIRAALPTISYLLQQGAAVILASHLGRPKGQVKEELRLTAVAKRLEELLKVKVVKTDDVVGPEVERLAQQLQPGQVMLLENVRFHPGEEKNERELAQAYAKLADVFVSDAFGTVHRAHASNVGVAEFLPAAAGFLMQKEVETLTKTLHNAQKPVLAIVGGSKTADKIGVIKAFLKLAETILLGGGMANTFLKAQGCQMGKSLVEDDQVENASQIMREAKALQVELCLPVDVTIAAGIDDAAGAQTVKAEAVPAAKMVLDIGPETRRLYAERIKQAGTVIWNGPLGVFEVDTFAQGTIEIAQAVAGASAFSLIGGGDVVAAVEKAGVADKISHLSTGGGAALEFWEGKELPGIVVLKQTEEV